MLKQLDARLTNGHWELPASARGVLVLADPPEAGWQMRTRSNEQATLDAELLAAPDYRPGCDQAADAHDDGGSTGEGNV